MSITALIAELFVGGALCLTWIMLIIGACIDIGPMLSFIRENQVSGTILVSVAIYAIGVVFDRIWDVTLSPITHWIERKHYPQKEELWRARKEIFGKEKIGSEFVNYNRSRMRIARAMTCNGLLVTIATLLYYFCHNPAPLKATIWVIICVGFMLCAISFAALWILTNSYYKSIKGFTGVF